MAAKPLLLIFRRDGGLADAGAIDSVGWHWGGEWRTLVSWPADCSRPLNVLWNRAGNLGEVSLQTRVAGKHGQL